MKHELWNRRLSLAVLNLVVCGVLALVLLASLGGGWGTAYGQTAGPGFTPTPDPGTIAGPGPVAPTAVGGTGIDAAPVVPGLPRTGSQSISEPGALELWQFGLIGLMGLLIISSSLLIIKYSKNRSR
jgi:hypothetical protein